MTHSNDMVLQEAFGSNEGALLWAKRAALVVAGVLALWIAAKIKIPMWPVPATMQTFVVLSIGAAYGMRLGVATILGYLLIGALGFNVFTNSGTEVGQYGLVYMQGTTGGYLVGFVIASAIMGYLARRGFDRSVLKMGVAMLIGNVVIYAFGIPWLAYLLVDQNGWAQVMAWGLTNFLLVDVLKLALAAVMFPVLWKLIGSART